jgi:RNA polymerase sigma-70 factor (ECF subfamily)
VYTIASNLCKNEFKRNEVRKNTSNGLDTHYQLSGADDVAQTVNEWEFKAALDRELLKLDTKHREVFILKHMDGLSIKEISEIVGINEGTVKSRLFYAIKKLATELKMFELVER